MGAGAPAFFTTPEELKQKLEEYFNDPRQVKTISGLAFYLGFESRQSFYDYEKREEFSYIIKRARLYIESKYEEKLTDPNISATGSIFALKNMGWKDKQETEHSGGMQLTWKEERTYEAADKTDKGT